MAAIIHFTQLRALCLSNISYAIKSDINNLITGIGRCIQEEKTNRERVL